MANETTTATLSLDSYGWTLAKLVAEWAEGPGAFAIMKRFMSEPNPYRAVQRIRRRVRAARKRRRGWA